MSLNLHMVVDDRRRSVPICAWRTLAAGIGIGVGLAAISVVAYLGAWVVP